MSAIDINALGQATDTSFGRSSSSRTMHSSVKINIAPGPCLNITYKSVVNFSTESQRIQLKKIFEEEGTKAIEAEVKNVKKKYKAACKDTLKLHIVGDVRHSCEIINMNVHNGIRTAYMVSKAIYEIDGDGVVSSTAALWKNS